jgi:hypothetical protein
MYVEPELCNNWLCAHFGGVHCSGSGPLSKNMSFEFKFTKNINKKCLKLDPPRKSHLLGMFLSPILVQEK